MVNLDVHKRKIHKLKYKALKCPDCIYVRPKIDHKLFLCHLMRSHGMEKSVNITGCVIDVPEGYYWLLRCPNCPFMGLRQDNLDRHQCQPHNKNYYYIGSTLWEAMRYGNTGQLADIVGVFLQRMGRERGSG